MTGGRRSETLGAPEKQLTGSDLQVGPWRLCEVCVRWRGSRLCLADWSLCVFFPKHLKFPRSSVWCRAQKFVQLCLLEEGQAGTLRGWGEGYYDKLGGVAWVGCVNDAPALTVLTGSPLQRPELSYLLSFSPFSSRKAESNLKVEFFWTFIHFYSWPWFNYHGKNCNIKNALHVMNIESQQTPLMLSTVHAYWCRSEHLFPFCFKAM